VHAHRFRGEMFAPKPVTDVWNDASAAALSFWQVTATAGQISDAFRSSAERNSEQL